MLKHQHVNMWNRNFRKRGTFHSEVEQQQLPPLMVGKWTTMSERGTTRCSRGFGSWTKNSIIRSFLENISVIIRILPIQFATRKVENYRPPLLFFCSLYFGKWTKYFNFRKKISPLSFHFRRNLSTKLFYIRSLH